MICICSFPVFDNFLFIRGVQIVANSQKFANFDTYFANKPFANGLANRDFNANALRNPFFDRKSFANCRHRSAINILLTF